MGITENQLASTFFNSALKLIDIDKKSIPKMAPWEIATLSKLLGKLGLRFWETATLEFNEVRAAEYKNKYYKKDIESDITKLSTKSKVYNIKKKILDAGGKINYNIRSFFSSTYTEINLEDTYKIDQLLNDDGKFPDYDTISEIMHNKITKKTYSELAEIAANNIYTTRKANLDPSKESSIGKIVTKIITKSNEKVRASIYESLSTSKGENHINNIQKWEKNYGIKFDRKAINKTLKTILKMKVEPRIKERLIRHSNTTFMKITSLYKLKIKKEKTCKQCKEKIEDWEHILFTCPISKQIIEVTRLHLNNTLNPNLPENITNYFLAATDMIETKKINEDDKIDVATLLALTISTNHTRYFNDEEKSKIYY